MTSYEKIPRVFNEKKTLQLFLLGLTDINSTLQKFVKNTYFDNNILNIVKEFIIEAISFGSVDNKNEQLLVHPCYIEFDKVNNQLIVLHCHKFLKTKRISIFSADGKKLLRTFGKFLGENFAIHPHTNLIIISENPNTSNISMYDMFGNHRKTFGNLPNTSGIACGDKTGNIFVSVQKKIQVFDAEGNYLYNFCALPCSFGYGHTLYIDSFLQEIYCADYNNDSIYVFSLNGTFLKIIKCDFSPKKVVLNVQKTEIIVSGGCNHLHIYNRLTGKYQDRNYCGKLDILVHISSCCVNNDILYIGDWANNCIQMTTMYK